MFFRINGSCFSDRKYLIALQLECVEIASRDCSSESCIRFTTWKCRCRVGLFCISKKKELEEDEKIKAEAEKKRIAEELKRTNLIKERAKISADEEKLKILKRDEEQTRKAADKLFLKANSRLKKALEGILNVKKEETEEARGGSNSVLCWKKEVESHIQ
ncbi:hypothetical protein PR048_013124 [Dryococelus australis]|uniref:Uncharacterized protein n=1 Tax=Dryococelus australis TaxID=614101 RepID=A0ABQ9HRL2_9NEOP|nr:hypothetical protein PR048_013124 [Dryococelus australis]